MPENFKKFISAKLSVLIFKKIKINDLINGSGVKEDILSYRGEELGSSILDIPTDKALIFDGKHYDIIEIPYLKEFDTKKENVPILVSKIVQKNIPKDLNIGRAFEVLENNALQEQHTLKVG